MVTQPAALFSGGWRGPTRRLFRNPSEATMKSRLLPCVLFALVTGISDAWAHEARTAFLEIKETAPGRYSVLWRTPVLAGMRLPVVLRFPDGVRDTSEPVTQWLTDSVVERRLIEAGAGGLAGKSIQCAGLQATITEVLAHVQTRDGLDTTTLVRPSQARLVVANPRSWQEIASDYILHGIQHISFGVDHLLFVLGLVLIVSDRWMLLKTVTAFSVAHSITLAIATLGYAEAPVVPLNAAIALSILFLGPEIVRCWRGETSLTIRHPWVVAFLFGLIHSFGFARALIS